MRIGKFATAAGAVLWGRVDETGGTVQPLDGPVASWAVAASGGEALPVRGTSHAIADLTLLAPVPEGARIFGVGMNYPTHLDDSGAALPIPEAMPGFLKLAESIVPPDAEIRHPASEQLDFEIELVAVLAKPLPDAGDATTALLGYTLGNDVSVRDAPRPGGMVDLYTMKAQDGTTPIGPWITTADALGGPGQPSIAFELRVNGEVRQQDDSANMLWSVDRILRSLDARNRLRAGDLVFTGTSGGTGMRDGRFLRPGDVVELEAEALGLLRHGVGPREPAPAG